MKQLLFVDDEEKVLDGLKRLLRPMRNEWTMTFVTSGEEALKRLEEAPFDVVVSDMRMPGMNGAVLLSEVQRRYPSTVRIVLSGQSDREMIFQSLGATHQFLSKPCEAAQLKHTIERACALRVLLASEGLRGAVTGISTIPSLPTLYMEIVREAESETGSLNTIGAIISKDIGMTAKLLQLVNSAFFGWPHPIANAKEAVRCLGLERVKALILTAHVFSQFTSGAGGSVFQIDRLWSESMETGSLAQAIASTEKLSASEVDMAYTAGLLHDVGMLVLAGNMAQRYGTVLEASAQEGLSVSEVEQRELGTTHAEVGAYLLGLWGLGEPIIEAVAYHHRPGDCLGQTFGPLTAVHVADVLLQEQAESLSGRVPTRIDVAYLERLQLTDRLPQWRELALAQRKETAQ